MTAPTGGRKARQRLMRCEMRRTRNSSKNPRVCRKCYDDIGCSQELGWTDAVLLLGISQKTHPHYVLLPSAVKMTENLLILSSSALLLEISSS